MSPQFTIVTPCSKKWARLTGDGRRRYCGECGKNVHAIGEYSDPEWERIWKESNGHACGVIAARSVASRRSRRAVLMGALLTLASPLLADSGRVRIRVKDATGAAFPGANVSRIEENGRVSGKVQTDSVGEAAWTDLSKGDTEFAISSFGFLTQSLIVTVRGSNEVIADVILQVATLMGELIEVKPKKHHWWSAS